MFWFWAPKLNVGVLAPLPEVVVLGPNKGFCPEVALAVPNNDGDEAPLDAPPPRLPNTFPPVFALWLDPNGEAELKSPPAEAPVDAGVPKENGLLDIFATRRVRVPAQKTAPTRAKQQLEALTGKVCIDLVASLSLLI